MTNEKAINILRGQESAYWATLSEAEHKAFDLAVDALTAKQPHVLTLEEVITAKKLDVWFEDKGDNIVHPLMLIETEMTNKSQTAYFYPMMVRPIKAYGKTWRCWTARPTDEQREAVKWE